MWVFLCRCFCCDKQPHLHKDKTIYVSSPFWWEASYRRCKCQKYHNKVPSPVSNASYAHKIYKPGAYVQLIYSICIEQSMATWLYLLKMVIRWAITVCWAAISSFIIWFCACCLHNFPITFYICTHSWPSLFFNFGERFLVAAFHGKGTIPLLK